ncbi:hypothetical protein LIER_24976 [Lithospermum erythrorhizon]|uniref:Uncharacterized protein n=1 Tax=Lithospermum erythrorhizon TaxID=34254 RepID=A0AAV3R733_LITER
MDEQGISSVFEDRLNPALYDLPVYERECPYVIRTNPANCQESLATRSSSSSSDDSDTSSVKCLNLLNRAETSISGGMPIIQAEGPLNFASLPQPLDPVNGAHLVTAEDVREEAARAKEAYQGMMASLPTFVKHSTPPDLTDDQLDGIMSYFSIPIEKVDTRLALPREQLYLSRIEEDSTDPDLAFDELVNIAASKEPQLVDFDDMLMDRPSLFARVPIITKTKPRESMIPEATSTSPPPTSVVHTPTINPLLKRMETVAPSVPPPQKKTKRTAPQKKKVLARDSSSVESPNREVQPTVGIVATPTNVVTLDSSTTVFDHGVNRQREANENCEASAQVPQFPKYNGLYLAKPYEVPNLELTNESPWGARKFHFHLPKPLLSKEMAAQYTPLVDPYAAFAHAMKHINQAIGFKNNLDKGLDNECKDQKAKLEDEAKRIVELT